ncbi:MAG: hypothetical protein SFU99_05515 [Saprospiraceae bacterium]|nr:hypothetical protein [Saprospiraceae bacterium]
MKKILYLKGLLLLSALSVSLSSCLKDECTATRNFITFEPVYRTEAQIRQDIVIEAPRALKNPGKIYIYGDYILVNELHEGIHVISNKDPRNPVNISFINIPGNVDMAVRNHILYADNYIDLVTIDIQNANNPKYLARTESVFPTLGFDPSRGHIVFYNEIATQQEVPCDWQNGNWFWQGDRVMVALDALNSFASANKGNVSGASTSGVGGSLARFTMASDYLYTVDNASLNIFDLTNAVSPKKANTVNLGWGIETIFPYEDKLFIGSQTGMFIFDNKNPLAPALLSTFQHARACDPVFVEGDRAYVTLRDGTTCENFNNQLDIVDISNLLNPRLLKTHGMHHPIGLSVVDKTVYLCDDDEGLKVFDASDWNKLNIKSHLGHFTTYDIITLPEDNRAIVIGKDGLYQFDITNPSKLQELSRIPVAK